MASSLLEPKGPSLARQHYRQRIRARRRALRVARFFIFVATIGLLLGGWYLAKRGFGRQYREKLVVELHKRGVEASIGRLTFDPLRGLIAQNVRIFDFKKRENTLAIIDRVAVDINYAALLHHEPFLNALDVRDAQINFPLATTNGGVNKAELKKFRAHVYFPPEQIYVSEAEGFFSGVRISARGQLIKRNDYKPSRDTTDEEWRRRIELLQRLTTELGKMSFPGDPPSVQIKFSGDLSHAERGRAEATVRADRLRRGSYEIKNLALDAEWSEQKLAVTHCAWSDASGNFNARANWSRETSAADFQAHSSLNLRDFFEAFELTSRLHDAQFSSPPLLEISGNANFSGTPRLNVIGRFAVENFNFKGAHFPSLTTDFSWDGERTMLRDVRLRHETGQLSGDLFDAPDDFRFNLESSLNPVALAAFAPPEVQRFLREWEFQRPPQIRLTIRSTERDPKSWNGDGSLALERGKFRGVAFKSANSAMHFADGAIHFQDFRVAREEGIGTGSCSYDFANHLLHLTNARTTLRPTEAIVWIEPRYFKFVTPYKFHQIPIVTANGTIHFHAPGDHMELTVESATGMDYEFLGKVLPVTRVSARLLFTDGRLQISDLVGDLYDGKVGVAADLALSKDDHRYHATVTADGVDFPKLTDLYFKYQTAHGRLSGSYDFTGAGDAARSMRGFGKIKVTDGDVFAIPIFGPLSGLLSAIIPGAGYSVAHAATADFTIRDGVIHTDNFKVSGKLFGLLGHGEIHFLEDRLDFDIKVAGGGAGALLTPVYNLFEYKGDGKIAKPNWHPKRF